MFISFGGLKKSSFEKSKNYILKKIWENGFNGEPSRRQQ